MTDTDGLNLVKIIAAVSFYVMFLSLGEGYRVVLFRSGQSIVTYSQHFDKFKSLQFLLPQQREASLTKADHNTHS